MYKVFIKIVILQIIFGIIIDAFAELRGNRNDTVEDLGGFCFMCSLDKQTFERNAEGFINHYRNDHRIWNYMFYIKKLENKDKTEYNGIETYVNNCIDKEDLGWYP